MGGDGIADAQVQGVELMPPNCRRWWWADRSVLLPPAGGGGFGQAAVAIEAVWDQLAVSTQAGGPPHRVRVHYIYWKED